MGARPVWTCAFLTLVAFLPRLATLLLVVGLRAPLAGDEHDYHDIAASWSAGEGWQERQNPAKYVRPYLELAAQDASLPQRDAPVDVDRLPPHRSARPPLTPLALGLVYRLTGPDVAAARLTMVALASLIAPALWLLGRAWRGPDSYAPLAAALVWAVYPYAVFDAVQIMTESLAGLLVVLSTWRLLRATQTRRLTDAAACGALWGLLALDRSNFVLLPLWLVAAQWLLARGSNTRMILRQWAVAALALAAVLTPWTVRNYRVHSVLMPTTSDLGRLLVACNLNLESSPVVQAGGYFHDPRYRGYLETFPEGQWTRAGVRLLIDRLPREPWRQLPGIVLRRAKNFWSYKYDPYESLRGAAEGAANPRVQRLKRIRNGVMAAVWLPLLAAALTAWLRPPGRHAWWLWATVLYAFAMALPFWGTPRFRLPVDGLIVLLAVTWGESWARSKRNATGGDS